MKPVEPGTIAFVPPRYGPGVVGGAEAVLAEAARGLRDRGHPVEILTTCARDHYTWANEFPTGGERRRRRAGPPLPHRATTRAVCTGSGSGPASSTASG